MTNVWIIVACIYGVLIGSFTNVLIYRIPNGLGVVAGRSFCPHCKHGLSWLELVPVLSYVALGGKCHNCKRPISFRYPGIELLSGGLYGLCIATFGLTISGVCWCLVSTCLIALSFIDFDEMIIPDRFPCIILGLGVVMCFDGTSPLTLTARILGFFSVSGMLLLIALVTRGRGMGGGDIKLMAPLGLCLGYQLCLLALPFAALFALAYAGGKTLLKKGTMRGEMPFGPFLSLASLCSAFWGNQLLAWYLGVCFG